jgi:hypothetical protein
MTRDTFEKMIKRVDNPSPFLLMIRSCNMDYALKLLEGLQTFSKEPGVYVIAADRKWLKTML